MPSVMLKKNTEGKLIFYVPKKDLEEVAESVEFDSPENGVVKFYSVMVQNITLNPSMHSRTSPLPYAQNV